MGLDMYLTAKRYISPYAHTKKERALGEKIGKLVGVLPVGDEAEDFRVEKVSLRCGYWRKANAVHNWFIQNCAGGNDWNNDPMPVSREQLAELRDLCTRVIEGCLLVPGKVANGGQSTNGGPMEPSIEDGQVCTNPELAAELLPTQSGFFFGSTDYDEWYIAGLVETVSIINRVLDLLDDSWEIEYEASW